MSTHPSQRKSARKPARLITKHNLDAEQVRLLDEWCSRSYSSAASQCEAEWSFKPSTKDLFQFYHRNDQAQMMDALLAKSAALTTRMGSQGSDAALKACEAMLAHLAAASLSERPKLEEIELAMELFKTARMSEAERVRADLKASGQKLDARRVALLEKKAAAFDRAQEILSTVKPGGLTPETIERIERELKLL